MKTLQVRALVPSCLAGPARCFARPRAAGHRNRRPEDRHAQARPSISTTKPEFTSVTLAPGRGMELLDVTANFPGKGEVHVLTTPGLDGAKKMLDV